MVTSLMRLLSSVGVSFFFAASFLSCVLPAFCQTAFKDLRVAVLGTPAPGYFFLGPNVADSFSVIDHSGKNVQRGEIGKHTNVQPYEHKWITYFKAVAKIPGFIRCDVNLKVIDTLRASEGYMTDFHECRIISDTSYLILGSANTTVDMSLVVSGGKPDANVITYVIQERTFSGNTLFEWRSLDHIPVTDATEDVALDVQNIDYIHINAVYKDTDGNILVSCRHLDEIIKINRLDGSVMWRLGGSKSKGNQFRFVNDTTNGFFGFSHQHSVSRSAAGTLLLFDNGNLKPAPRASRAVEYAIDEVALTVSRVFQYVPAQTVHSSAMGSVQELENGNLLIGYGTNSLNLLAQEVSRDGKLHVQISTDGEANVSSYRVLKQAMFMTGAYKQLTSLGSVSFARGDSSTHFSIVLKRIDDTTTATAERHSYAPHHVSFTSERACGVLDTRWVFGIRDTMLVAGTMAFDVGDVPGVEFPDQIKLYHRPREGWGDFTLVETSYNATKKRIVVGRLMAGEFLIGYDECFSPTLLSPPNFATEITSSPMLAWSEALTTGEYQVELSTSPAFANTYARFLTRRLDTTLTSVPAFSTLYWRVRSKETASFGLWSEVSQFTTQIGIPFIAAPAATVDTIAVLTNQSFSWSPVFGAAQYRVIITANGSLLPVLDTIVVPSSFKPGALLAPNTKYTWQVRALYDTVKGRMSASAFFVTSPLAPLLVSPLFDAENVPTDYPVFDWSAVPGAIKYVLTIKSLADGSTVSLDTAAMPPFTIESLPTAIRASWTCYAIGVYGRGPDAIASVFNTSAVTTLAAARTVGPKRASDIDTLNVMFSWTLAPLARSYDIQITSKQSFRNPDYEAFGVSENSVVIPSLKPGVTYAWRVFGYNNTATGTWSDTASFTTNSSPSQGLTPSSPAAGSIDVPLSGVFRYSTSESYSSYAVQVSRDASFDAPDFQFFSGSGNCLYAGLRLETEYFWRAIGKSRSNPDEYGAIASFTTVKAVTEVDEEHTPSDAITANVVGDNLFIRIPNPEQKLARVDLYSLQGTLVYSATNGDVVSRSIGIPSLASGAYYLILQFSDCAHTIVPLVKY